MSVPPPAIRVVLPAHLRTLAGVDRGEIAIEVAVPVTVRAVVAALEVRYPTLRGTLRDPATDRRRPLVRYFACARDLSHDSEDAPLPAAIVDGTEPLLVVGAMAGG